MKTLDIMIQTYNLLIIYTDVCLLLFFLKFYT